jgi:putative transposase
VDFIDQHKDCREADGLRWGVEPICAVLSEHGVKIAASTYYEWKGKAPTSRQRRDEALKAEIVAAYNANFQVYGARKIWLVLNRQGTQVARCTVERLMRQMGLRGVHRGKVKRTTIPDPNMALPSDLVNRRFGPLAPNRLWVADFTYVSTWAGWAYCAFVIDAYARRILGWRISTTMNTDMVLDALNQALWQRQREHRADFDHLVTHADYAEVLVKPGFGGFVLVGCGLGGGFSV